MKIFDVNANVFFDEERFFPFLNLYLLPSLVIKKTYRQILNESPDFTFLLAIEIRWWRWAIGVKFSRLPVYPVAIDGEENP